MIIPCIRCQAGIEKPHAGNARYIQNVSDTRTHGPRELDEFDVENVGVVSKTFKKFKDAQNEREVVVSPIHAAINFKKEERAILLDDLKNLPDIPGNASARAAKAVEIIGKNSEVEIESEKITKIRVVSRPITKTVAKTGIICLKKECQNENDTIIWG